LRHLIDKLSLVLSIRYFDLPTFKHLGGRRGRVRMVVGFTTTCAIKSCEFESRSWRGVLNTTLCDEVCQWLS